MCRCPMLEIGRIRFRPLMRDDLSTLAKWKGKLEVTLFSAGEPFLFMNDEDIERDFEDYMDNKNEQRFIIEMRNDDKKIGLAYYRDLTNQNKVKNAKIGTYIGEEEYWAKGLGKEITLGLADLLLYHRNFDRLSVMSAAVNKRAHETFEAVGFKKTGRARKKGYLFGKRIDWYLFDLLREEYMSNRDELLDKILGKSKEDYLTNFCSLKHRLKKNQNEEKK